jgi:hypothetical protein
MPEGMRDDRLAHQRKHVLIRQPHAARPSQDDAKCLHSFTTDFHHFKNPKPQISNLKSQI